MLQGEKEEMFGRSGTSDASGTVTICALYFHFQALSPVAPVTFFPDTMSPGTNLPYPLNFGAPTLLGWGLDWRLSRARGASSVKGGWQSLEDPAERHGGRK